MAKENGDESSLDGEQLWKSIYQASDDEGETDQETVTAEVEDAPQPRDSDSAATEDQGDELDGLTLQNAQERIKNAQARMHAATMELGEIRKEMEPLRRENLQLRNDLQLLQQEMARQQELMKRQSSPSVDSGIDDDDLKSAKEEWPEVVNPLLKRNQALEARLRQLEEQISETVTVTKETQLRTAEETHRQTIIARHQDAFEVADTDEFRGWIARQPPVVQQIVASGAAADVIWLLDQYKALTGTGNRLEQAREASTPTTPRARQLHTRGGPKFTRAQIEAMTPDEWRSQEAEILRAMAQGQIA